MTADQFAYWLQGFSELNVEPPSAEQWQSIRDHLALVFNKVTPSVIGTPLDWTWETIEPKPPRRNIRTRSLC